MVIKRIESKIEKELRHHKRLAVLFTLSAYVVTAMLLLRYQMSMGRDELVPSILTLVVITMGLMIVHLANMKNEMHEKYFLCEVKRRRCEYGK